MSHYCIDKIYSFELPSLSTHRLWLLFIHLFIHPTYVVTNTDNETRCLKITRKQSTIGGSCQPANDLCPIAALVRLSSCQSAACVLLWSRGAAHGLIGVAWSCSTWKKSQCHLVTLGRAAKLLAGGWSGHVAEEGCVLSTVVMNHCAARLSFPYPSSPPVCPTPHPPPHPITNAVIIRLWRVGHLQ